MFVLIPVAIAYFVLLGFYIREDLHGSFARATKLKMTLSSIFCAVGAAGLLLPGWRGAYRVRAVLRACRRLFFAGYCA